MYSHLQVSIMSVCLNTSVVVVGGANEKLSRIDPVSKAASSHFAHLEEYM